ncbi:hypothetical protein ES319_A05G270200v1 [Gossypium barbadense]|nr:hypothetical protein ES319_A05G270200v1 [Gossypium barbadense]TYI28984.1 hypothetical protein ES332_A05G283600v1 [Gossypium tomentosum]
MEHYCEGSSSMPEFYFYDPKPPPRDRSKSSLVECNVKVYLNHCCLPVMDIRSCTSWFLKYHINHKA